ncbi:MAG: alpha-amylase family glycosyl hydrolase [Melioribacter sp.]|jgi:1,4-alpha-glucan branching enzyme|uniref:alpha-amylase family glycosyl hydrolase n=1 Tax=Melioribacter sp. TaxID=2052167 RepID=UPI003BC9032B
MKKNLLVFVFLLTGLIVGQNGTGTVFYTVPQYPVQTDTITITFDVTNATHPNKIAGYQGDVYAHTGVTLRDENGNVSAWQNVIGDWGNNSVQPKLSRVAENVYRITIENPRKFYNVNNPAVDITQLCFVLRSSDGSKQTEDIFVPIYEPGITVVLNSPAVNNYYGDPMRSPYFIPDNNPVLISARSAAIGTSTKRMSLFINDQLLAESNADSIVYSFVPDPNIHTNIARIIAEGITGLKDTVEFAIVNVPPVPVSQMPEGIQHGINYKEDGIYLALFAPYKKFVYVLGDFNDWKVDDKYLMNKYEARPDSVIYWIKLNDLTPSTEYAFQYLVDGVIRMPDPYCEKILDPWNDSYIPSTVYPNLKEYPYGKTENIVGIINTTPAKYNWKVTDFEKPPKEKLVIYETLVRDFVKTHSFATLIDTISYFKKLGVNAIELMPVMEFEGNSSWGYNSMMHFAVDKYYGTAEKLKEFIDSCHSNGIAVILDVVLNHAFGLNPLVRMYWDTAQGRPSADSPWFNQVSPNPVFYWGYDFNHESNNTKYYVDRVTSYWLNEFKVDGFRFDFTKGFTNTPGDGGNYDATRIKILKRMADKVWQADPEAYVILEHFAADSEERELSQYGMMLWGNLNHNYSEAAMGWNDAGKSNFNRISYKARGFSNPHLVGYMESHDEERLMYKNLHWGNSSGDYDIKKLNYALGRIKLAAAFFITVPGPKMMWQFEELGYDYSIDYNGRLGEKPVRWDYYTAPEQSERQKLFRFFAELIKLKKSFPVFSTDDFNMNVTGPTKEITLLDSAMNVKIIGNFDVVSRSVNFSFPEDGYWYDYFTGDSISVENGSLFVSLQPGEFHLYTSVKLPVPPDGKEIITKTEYEENFRTNDFTVSPNYPNPFNPGTTLEWRLPESGRVAVSLYNILGQKIAVLLDEYQSAGKHSYYLNADKFNLSSGTYFVNYNLNGSVKTQKIVLIK